jgi:hypothetical protein
VGAPPAAASGRGGGGTTRFCAGEVGVHVDHRSGEGDEATAVDVDRAATTTQLRAVVAGGRVTVTAQPRAIVAGEHIAATAQLCAAVVSERAATAQLATLVGERAARVSSSTHSNPFHLSPT